MAVFKAVADTPSTPVLTPSQRAEKLTISRNKLLVNMLDSVKRAKETVTVTEPSESLVEAEMLEQQLREIHSMWMKTGDLAESMMEIDLTQWDTMKTAQEAIVTKTNQDVFQIQADVRKLMGGSRKIKE